MLSGPAVAPSKVPARRRRGSVRVQPVPRELHSSGPHGTSQIREPPHRSATAAELFRRLWGEVVDLVGTAATAALLRRALKHASATQPELAEVVLRREGLEYAWSLPAAWHDPERRDAVEGLRRLVRDDLQPLFRELTGLVIARRLAQVPELVEAGLAGEEANHDP